MYSQRILICAVFFLLGGIIFQLPSASASTLDSKLKNQKYVGVETGESYEFKVVSASGGDYTIGHYDGDPSRPLNVMAGDTFRLIVLNTTIDETHLLRGAEIDLAIQTRFIYDRMNISANNYMYQQSWIISTYWDYWEDLYDELQEDAKKYSLFLARKGLSNSVSLHEMSNNLIFTTQRAVIDEDLFVNSSIPSSYSQLIYSKTSGVLQYSEFKFGIYSNGTLYNHSSIITNLNFSGISYLSLSPITNYYEISILTVLTLAIVRKKRFKM